MNWTEDEYQEYLRKQGIKTVKDKPKKAKYKNKHIWVDGICFDSIKESKYYLNLKLLLKAGAIKASADNLSLF